MANDRAIIQQIRFALEQLSVQNAHHEFEHMCRHLSRRKICSNILPATGPVSAGGDQGRDFETFRTYIRDSEIGSTAFVGATPDGPIVFACTLQRDAVSQKIKSDIVTILGSGIRPECIYIFLGSDFAVSKRHKVQRWANDEHEIHLEILDGQAISETLCDPEIFWIAEQFLSVPREFRPERNPDEIEHWYTTALERWEKKDDFPLIPANFHEITSAARHATYGSESRSDVPLWVSRLERFRAADAPAYLARRATYEIAVACLRGLGTLENREEELRIYFAAVPSLHNPSELEDAAVLLKFCYGACLRDAVQIPIDELHGYHEALIDRLDTRIHESETASTKCSFLNTKGYATFLPFSSPGNSTELDVSEAVECWQEMLRLVDGAPLFPLDRFADHLTELLKLVGEFQGYLDLARQVDERLSARIGGFAAADKCRDRAIAFYEKGRVLSAIEELHRAKIGWFADETLEGAVLALLLLADWYRELGLVVASKQYAMAAAFICVDTTQARLKRFAPKAFLSIAECEYAQGNWIDFVGRVDATLLSHQLVPNQDAPKVNDERELQVILLSLGTLLMAGERFAPGLGQFVEDGAARWDIEEFLADLRPLLKESWGGMSDDEFWEKLEAQLAGRPYGDVGRTRVTVWKQLGITWRVEYDNESQVVARAEEFIASAQILMSEWAGRDLCLLRTTIKVKIQVDKAAEDFSLDVEPSNAARLWTLTIPTEFSREGGEGTTHFALANTIAILSEASLLPISKFMQRVEDRFKDGVFSRAFAARPYHELYLDLSYHLDSTLDRHELVLPAADREFEPVENPVMAWFSERLPGYTVEAAEKGIRARYLRGIKPVRLTVARLKKDRDFKIIVQNLRKSGWKDWHLLIALVNIVLNFRVVQPKIRKGEPMQEIQESMRRFMERDEGYEDAWIPSEKFSEQSMREALQTSQISTLRNEGLEPRQETPDFPAIDDFLRYRMGYWADDVEHDPVFE